MIVRKFVLDTGEGETIDGEVRLPSGPPPRAAVVISHGFKGFKDWAFFPHVAAALAEEGFAAVTFNFSRNGVSANSPEEFTELESFARNTLSRELSELGSVVDATLEGVTSGRRFRRIGLLGHSRGGALSVLAAASAPHVEALATWGAVASFDRWSADTVLEWREAGRLHVLNGRTGQQMPLDLTLLEDFELNRDRLDVVAAARRIEVPWLIVHGEDDLTVHVHDAHRLVEASRYARLVLIEEAGHTFNVGHPFEGSSEALTHALQSTARYFSERLSLD